jgi:hypothetical protein
MVEAWQLPRRLSLPGDNATGNGSNTAAPTPSSRVLHTPHSPFAQPFAIPPTPLTTIAGSGAFAPSSSLSSISSTITSSITATLPNNNGSVVLGVHRSSSTLGNGNDSSSTLVVGPSPQSPEHYAPYPPLSIDVITPLPTPPPLEAPSQVVVTQLQQQHQQQLPQ